MLPTKADNEALPSEPTRDTNNESNKPPIQIGIWGMPRSGKTVYLTMLYLGLDPRTGWNIRPADAASERLLLNAREIIKERRLFPDHTDKVTHYSYTIAPPSSEFPNVPAFKLTFVDMPGELDRAFYAEAVSDPEHPVEVPKNAIAPQLSDITPQQRFNNLMEMDGLLLFIDPAWHDLTRQEYSYRQLLLNLIRQLDAHRRKPYSPLLALCMVKAEVKDSYWERRKLTHSCYRENVQTISTECRHACPLYEFLTQHTPLPAPPDGIVISDFMERDLLNALGTDRYDNLKCFVLSAVGRSKADEKQKNIAFSDNWVRGASPRPPWATAEKTSFNPTADDWLENVDLYHSPYTDRPFNDYYPTGIIDANLLQPENLIDPIKWILKRAHQK